MDSANENTVLWPLLVYTAIVCTLIASILIISYVLGQHHKDRATDELAWRQYGPGIERRKASNKQIPALLKPKPAIQRVKKNAAGTRVGYNPYESGELVRQNNPGVRRNLRELGRWLKGQPREKGIAERKK